MTFYFLALRWTASSGSMEIKGQLAQVWFRQVPVTKRQTILRIRRQQDRDCHRCHRGAESSLQGKRLYHAQLISPNRL